MQTGTIDERIRKQAQRSLQKELDEAFGAVTKLLRIQGTTDKIKVKVLSDDKESMEVEAYNRDLLKSIKDAAFTKLAPSREERAVTEFLNKVDNLNEQVQHLYQEFED